MTPQECPREPEIVSLVVSRRWAQESDDELRAHASECDVCREALEVASLLHEEEQFARRDVQVPAAGQVWWRAAIRARVEAIQAAERPMTWLHGLAGACAVGLVVGLLSLAWPSVEAAAAWLGAYSWSVTPSTGETGQLVLSTVQRSLPIVAIAALVILAPIAIYFATNDE